MSPLALKILPGLAGYVAFLVVLSVVTALFVRYQTSWEGKHLYRTIWGWFGRWHLLVGLITVAGGMAGSVIYPVAGTLLRMDLSPGTMSLNGLRDGAFYALIWAPGISFVACIIQGRRRRGEPGRPRGLST